MPPTSSTSSTSSRARPRRCSASRHRRLEPADQRRRPQLELVAAQRAARTRALARRQLRELRACGSPPTSRSTARASRAARRAAAARSRRRRSRCRCRAWSAHVAHEVLDDRAIDVVAAEERVAGRREHLEHAALDVDDRDVERAAAEVAHEVAAIRRRGARRGRAPPRSAR